MACDIITAKGAVFAVWGHPTVRDIDEVMDALRSTASRWSSSVTYITRVPNDSPAPDPVVRRHLNSIMHDALHYCSSYHVVLEGEGFVAAFKRGVLVSLTQLTPRRGTFFVHSHVSEVVSCVSKLAQRNVVNVLQMAAAQGLLLTGMQSQWPMGAGGNDRSSGFRQTAP